MGSSLSAIFNGNASEKRPHFTEKNEDEGDILPQSLKGPGLTPIASSAASSIFERIESQEEKEKEIKKGVESFSPVSRGVTKQDSWTSTKLEKVVVPSVKGRRGSVKVNLTIEEHAEAAVSYTFPNISGKADDSMRVVLVPHVHTLFCERRERVCLSHGKLQEHERITVYKGDCEMDAATDGNVCWYRTTANHIKRHTSSAIPEHHEILSSLQEASFDPIEGTQGKVEYQLTQDDVDCFLKFSLEGEGGERKESVDIVGPVLPAPPRLTEISVVGKLVPGGYAVASAHYTGGCQGSSEFWWLSIRQGERTPLGDPQAATTRRSTAELVELAQRAQQSEIDETREEARKILAEEPRVVYVRDEDVGSVFKVKCRPVRSDGHRGEIFTSKASGVVQLEAAHS